MSERFPFAMKVAKNIIVIITEPDSEYSNCTVLLFDYVKNKVVETIGVYSPVQETLADFLEMLQRTGAIGESEVTE